MLLFLLNTLQVLMRFYSTWRSRRPCLFCFNLPSKVTYLSDTRMT